jgi:hypothetical protein
MEQQEPSLMNRIQSEISNVGDMVKESTSNISNKVGEIADSTKSVFDTGVDSVKSVLPPAPIPADGNSFSLADYTTMSSEFLESNSYVARAAFILLVVFAFFVLLRVATAVIKYFIGRKSMPVKLIDGMHDGANKLGPLSQGVGSSYTIPRSINEENGIEFTWAVSLYIKDHPRDGSKIRHIFSKGSIPTFTDTDSSNKQTGITTINQAPGLYFHSSENKLIVNMDTFNNSSTSTINIETIPHNKWLNVLIRCKQTLVDVYINGQIAKSTVLPSTPKQNYGNVYISEKGGFVGNISNLFYYNYALSINEIQKLLEDSVNTQLTSEDGVNNKITDYLGFRWYV